MYIIARLKTSLNREYLFPSIAFGLGLAVLAYELIKNIWI